METLRLGDIAKDLITGYEGVVVCISTWLHGCRRITLQARECAADGKPKESCSFDEPQLTRVPGARFNTTSNTGGPRPEPVVKREASR